jgi:hypothetical protein
MHRFITASFFSITLAYLIPFVAHANLAYTDQQQLHSIVKKISAKNIEKDITKLVSFGTRHTLSETQSSTRGIGAARRWIKAEFEAISAQCNNCLEVYFQKDTVSGEKRIPEPTEVVSVIAVLKGQTDPQRYVIMSGDIDSRVTDPMNALSDSPGANDNASGVAGCSKQPESFRSINLTVQLCLLHLPVKNRVYSVVKLWLLRPKKTVGALKPY